jgi:hypothetical protein
MPKDHSILTILIDKKHLKKQRDGTREMRRAKQREGYGGWKS